jgi:hypothetical protein
MVEKDPTQKQSQTMSFMRVFKRKLVTTYSSTSWIQVVSGCVYCIWQCLSYCRYFLLCLPPQNKSIARWAFRDKCEPVA